MSDGAIAGIVVGSLAWAAQIIWFFAQVTEDNYEEEYDEMFFENDLQRWLAWLPLMMVILYIHKANRIAREKYEVKVEREYEKAIGKEEAKQ